MLVHFQRKQEIPTLRSLACKWAFPQSLARIQSVPTSSQISPPADSMASWPVIEPATRLNSVVSSFDWLANKRNQPDASRECPAARPKSLANIPECLPTVQSGLPSDGIDLTPLASAFLGLLSIYSKQWASVPFQWQRTQSLGCIDSECCQANSEKSLPILVQEQTFKMRGGVKETSGHPFIFNPYKHDVPVASFRARCHETLASHTLFGFQIRQVSHLECRMHC